MEEAPAGALGVADVRASIQGDASGTGACSAVWRFPSSVASKSARNVGDSRNMSLDFSQQSLLEMLASWLRI